MVINGKVYVLKNKRRFYSFVISLFLIPSLLFFAGKAGGYTKNSAENIAYIQYMVTPGDTLWDIAMKYRENIEIRKFIKQIMQLNDMEDAYIYTGCVLNIPVESTGD